MRRLNEREGRFAIRKKRVVVRNRRIKIIVVILIRAFDVRYSVEIRLY